MFNLLIAFKDSVSTKAQPVTFDQIDDLVAAHFGVGFWLSFIFTLILVILAMEALRYLTTCETRKMIPTESPTNEVVPVIGTSVHIAWIRISLVLLTGFFVWITRGAAGLPFGGYFPTLEISIIALFTIILYMIAGPMIGKSLTLRIAKSLKFKGIPIITEDEYAKLITVPKPPPTP